MEWFDVVILSVNSILLATNLIGNGVVCIVIARNKRARAARDLLILNLALADLAFGIFFSPIRIFSYAYTHPTGGSAKWLCKFVTSGMFGWLASTASVTTLTLLAGERFLAVTKPIPYRSWLTKRKTRRMNICIWLVAVVFNLPLFFAFDFSKETKKCYEYFPSEAVAKFFAFFWGTTHFFIPASIMLICYGCVVYTLYTNSKQQQRQAVMKSRKKVSKIIATVTVIYMLCWGPEALFYLFFGDWGSGDVAYAVLETMLLLNSSVNPIIYSLWSKRFREHIKITFNFAGNWHFKNKPCKVGPRSVDTLMLSKRRANYEMRDFNTC